jgi:peptidyl-prolyl cis-trans isomerase A (cyclophilin A)
MTKPRALLSLTSLLLASVLALGCKKDEAAPAAPPPPPPAEPVKAPEPVKPPEPIKAAAEATPPPADAAPAKPAAPQTGKAALLAPKSMTEQAPAKFKAKFTTSKGEFVVEVQRDWAPVGADRFYNLVKNGYYDEVRFFRVVKGFMVQFGISGDPAINKVMEDAQITDDPVKQSNKRGYVTFAKTGMPNSRTSQIFINYKDNDNLDGMGFAPFGKVVSGMKTVDALNGEYGEGAPGGMGPNQGRMQSEGNAYLQKEFAKLDYIKSAKLVK